MPIVTVPKHLTAAFEGAGWYPERAVALPAGVPVDHPAASLLATLSGLAVGRTGKGIECAASDIRFGFVPSRPDVSAWGDRLGTSLLGVAEYHNAHAELFVDTSSRCFGQSRIHDAFYFEGDPFWDAVARIIEGRRARPLLRPGQGAVRLYGHRFTADSPELYRVI